MRPKDLFVLHLCNCFYTQPVTRKRRRRVEAIKKFVKEEEGATAIEYGLLAGLIALVIILAVTNLGKKINALFTNVTAALP
jgi:pilus assembly protein Flp/PilA